MTYSIIGILAAVILLIINRDALWGILDMHRLTALQYADTALHFAAMIAAVMLWTRYAVSYLENETRLGSLLCRTGSLFFLAELIVIGVNFFYPVLFRFDENGGYHAGILRYVTLAVQILMFLLTSGYTLSVTIRSEGVDKDRIRQGRREDYDLLLIDWKMPEMDGLETTRQIRAMDRPDAKTIPIIALTANAFDEDVQQSMQVGLNAHLSKPVDAEALFGTLESLIGSAEEHG